MNLAEIYLHESDEGILLFDTEKLWFYFRTDENTYPICLYRPGNFDLTQGELKAIHYLMEQLKDGLFQN